VRKCNISFTAFHFNVEIVQILLFAAPKGSLHRAWEEKNGWEERNCKELATRKRYLTCKAINPYPVKLIGGLVNFSSASILTLSLPITTLVPYANSLDLDETPSNSASHADPSCLTLRQHFQKFWATLKRFENLSRREMLQATFYLVGLGLKVLQCHSKLVKMSECQTAWIQMRRWFTQSLIQVQAVCIWHFSCDWWAKG